MTPAKTIYLVRHGTTDYNEADFLQGRIDNPLNNRGKEECRLLSDALKDEKIEVIFHSPMERARQTAEILNHAHQARCQEVDCFVEIDLGEWEGVKYSQMIDQDPVFYQQWISDASVAVPGGESFIQVFNRVKPGVEQVLNSGQENILIVGHATVNRCILAHILRMDPAIARAFRIRNASYSKLWIRENSRHHHAVVDSWNITSHLGALK